MLLLEIEQTIKPLPRVAKIQLIQDIAEMLKAETDDVARDVQPGQEVGYFGPINEPEIAAQLQEMLHA